MLVFPFHGSDRNAWERVRNQGHVNVMKFLLDLCPSGSPCLIISSKFSHSYLTSDLKLGEPLMRVYGV